MDAVLDFRKLDDTNMFMISKLFNMIKLMFNIFAH